MTIKQILLPNAICALLLTVTYTQAAQANEIKLIVPFAVPVGVPVAPFAPYFYSYQATQPRDARPTLPLPLGEGRGEGAEPNPSRGSTSAAITTHQSSLTPVSPLIATHCAACHGGLSPKASLSFDSLDKLSPDVRLKAIRAVVSGRMPIGEKLSPDEVRSLVQEFTDSNHGVAEAQR